MKNNTGLRVPYALAVHGKEEEKRVLRVLREKRTIMGKEVLEFEKKIADIFNNKYAIMVNSGSSANEIAVNLLNLNKGAEVITPILTFSTTVAPLVRHGLTPVFIDVTQGEYTITIDKIEPYITKNTKALMIPLLLGNVPDLKKIQKIAKKYKLKIIIDSCDTLGATFDNRSTGEYGDISTTSFYGSHIITAGGGGGMITTDNVKLAKRARILRGWGRGSASLGESEDIGKRFKAAIGDIQYDSKFIFNEIGYNFLPMEIGAAFGNAQLDKLKKFRKIRESNFISLYKFFKKYEDYFILPHQDSRVKTQWLAFPLTIKNGTSFKRYDLMSFLEKNNIQTRPIFSGIITEQPGFKEIVYKGKDFKEAQLIMENGFLIGCHQGLNDAHLLKIKNVFEVFLSKHR